MFSNVCLSQAPSLATLSLNVCDALYPPQCFIPIYISNQRLKSKEELHIRCTMDHHRNLKALFYTGPFIIQTRIYILLHFVYNLVMGIVKISEEIHDQLRKSSKVFDRSLNSQAEHWIKIGMLCELHPSINYEEIRDLLFKYHDLSIEKIIKKKK